MIQTRVETKQSKCKDNNLRDSGEDLGFLSNVFAVRTTLV